MGKRTYFPNVSGLIHHWSPATLSDTVDLPTGSIAIKNASPNSRRITILQVNGETIEVTLAPNEDIRTCAQRINDTGSDMGTYLVGFGEA